MSIESGATEEGRHASWLELFFDLVVVVAVAQVAHRLHEPSWPELGISLLLFGAVWFTWASFTMYANVQAEQVRVPMFLLGMFGISVMAAAVHEADGDRALAFALAYVGTRLLAVSAWSATGQMLASWPSVQTGAGLLPWIASIWVDGNGRYILWAVGLAIDVLVPAIMGIDGHDRLEQRMRERGRSTTRQFAHLEVPHLAERLGLFVIIVLGEAIAQIVSAASEIDWDLYLLSVGVSGFILVVTIWWLVFRFGFTAAPNVQGTTPPARIAMPIHLGITASLMVVAAGLGSFAAHPEGPAPSSTGALLCGGTAAYLAVSAITGGFEGGSTRWLLGWGIPSTTVAVALAFLSPHLPVVLVVWLLVVVVGWYASHALVRQRMDA